MPLFSLVQARPWFRSSMWISSVAGISKVLCTSEVANATRTSVRMQDILRLGTNSSWCVYPCRGSKMSDSVLLAITASQWRNVLFDPCSFEAPPRYFVFPTKAFFEFPEHFRSVGLYYIQSCTFHGVGLGLNAQVVIFLLPHWKFFYLLLDEFYILLRIFNVLH